MAEPFPDLTSRLENMSVQKATGKFPAGVRLI